MPADPNRARDVFLAAFKLSPEQRPGYLAEACGAAQDLRAAVDRLLLADAVPGSIVGSASSTTAHTTAASGPGYPVTVDLPSNTSATAAFDPGAARPNEMTTEERGLGGATSTFAGDDPDATSAMESTTSFARNYPEVCCSTTVCLSTTTRPSLRSARPKERWPLSRVPVKSEVGELARIAVEVGLWHE
jgi:hypothetical protein